MSLAEEEDEGGGIPEWVVTFGDMMSLLLTFFIMLCSMSEIKEEQRYQAMVDSLRKRFGHDAAILSAVPGKVSHNNSALEKLASMGRSRRADIMRGGAKVRAPIGDSPRPVHTPESGRIAVGGVVFFPEQAWMLDEKQKRTLENIASNFGGKPQIIEIRGHTSNAPLPKGSPFLDHWDLAYARCNQARNYLVKLGINPKRIRISVAAANEPRHKGNDPILARENSRVEIFMLSELAGDLSKASKQGG